MDTRHYLFLIIAATYSSAGVGREGMRECTRSALLSTWANRRRSQFKLRTSLMLGISFTTRASSQCNRCLLLNYSGCFLIFLHSLPILRSPEHSVLFCSHRSSFFMVSMNSPKNPVHCNFCSVSTSTHHLFTVLSLSLLPLLPLLPQAFPPFRGGFCLSRLSH